MTELEDVVGFGGMLEDPAIEELLDLPELEDVDSLADNELCDAELELDGLTEPEDVVGFGGMIKEAVELLGFATLEELEDFVPTLDDELEPFADDEL